MHVQYRNEMKYERMSHGDISFLWIADGGQNSKSDIIEI